MRLLLLLLVCVGCAPAPSEPRVVRKSSAVCAVPVDCVVVADTSTVWIGGIKYMEIVERCQ